MCLDSPFTCLPFIHCASLVNLEVLKITLIEIEGFNIEPFLTRFLSRKARLNSSITIRAFATGAQLSRDQDASGIAAVAWPLKHETKTILDRILASPMPLVDSASNFCLANSIANDTFGRIVTSLQLKKLKTRARIVLPSSATKATICVFQGCNDASMRPARADGLLTLSVPEMTLLGGSLVYLDMHYRAIYPINFPYTLKYLQLRSAVLVETPHFPPKLEVLIWWAPTPLLTLPSSLKHLAFLKSGLLGSTFLLPHLKTVHIEEVDQVHSLQFLPLGQLDAFIVLRTIIKDCVEASNALVDNITFWEARNLADVVNDIDARYYHSDSFLSAYNHVSPSSQTEEPISTPAIRKKAIRRPR